MRLFTLFIAAASTTAFATPADWHVRVAPFDGIYPSLELSQARRNDGIDSHDHALGGGSGLVAVTLTALHAGEKIALSMRVPTFDEPERYAVTLADADRTYELHPPLDWNVPQLTRLRKPLATRVEFALERDGRDAGSRSARVSIHPLDEALYFVRDGKDSVDLSWIFAAYVDERAPTVDAIIEVASGSGIVDHFDGYSDADSDAVFRQVWAVWHALAARGIRYSSADPAIERGPNVFSQRVRFLGDTWNDRSANCIDGSVMIASVLQRVGIRSFLVLVPGHAFVGFYTDADAQHAAYLETTLLGAAVPQAAQLPAFGTTRATTPDTRQSLNNFAAALAAGRVHHARVAAKLDGHHRPDFAVIDIAAARAFGIRPIETREDQP